MNTYWAANTFDNRSKLKFNEGPRLAVPKVRAKIN